MKVAITGGTGFVGRNIARALTDEGHEVVLLERGFDQNDLSIRTQPRARFVSDGLDKAGELTKAVTGCETVVHCAGINRELGEQTFRRVHVEGTGHVVEAAKS